MPKIILYKSEKDQAVKEVNDEVSVAIADLLQRAFEEGYGFNDMADKLRDASAIVRKWTEKADAL